MCVVSIILLYKKTMPNAVGVKVMKGLFVYLIDVSVRELLVC